ncbi:methyl-accepting chemotaxis protein [Gorillibacterium sp. sgz5001074]|uniref:methyl-accepting chemotaxis protein n=1 Tax=Gorillibacterium sp. sgz5001074 TaxID=3446695 RepID=UPI003F6720ED
MSFFRTLRFRLTAMILLMVLLPLIGLASFQIQESKSRLTDNIRFQEELLAHTTAMNINHWLQSKVNVLNKLLQDNPNLAVMPSDKANLLAGAVRQYDPDTYSSFAVDRKGSLPIGNKEFIDVSQAPEFVIAAQQKKPAFGDLIPMGDKGGYSMTLMVPLLTEKQEFTGTIGSMINTEALNGSLGPIKIGASGYAYMISDKGVFIHHPDKTRIGQSFEKASGSESYKKAISEEVLKKERGYAPYVDSEGVRKLAGFSTVPVTGWKVVVVAPEDEVFEVLNRSIRNSMFMIAAAVLLALVLAFLTSGFIAGPVLAAVGYVNRLAEADFTGQAPARLKVRKDEIGALGRSLDGMTRSIQSVLRQVHDETSQVKANIDQSSTSIHGLAVQIEDVSATTEEISAGMEETSAMAMGMNATSVELEQAVSSIAVKAQEGSGLAEQISGRALGLKDTAIRSREAARTLHAQIEAESRTALAQASSVNQIEQLTGSILEITTQTNLLALNAAIEAARAGEAGRGFAVVAGEIRKLAEHSARTAAQIQEVTKEVTQSVESLTQSSEKALTFIDTAVIRDYDTMVNTGEQYYRDSEAFQELVTDFSATSEQLLASIQSLVQSINEVALSNNEGARGTTTIAERTSDAMEKSAEVASLMSATEQTAQKLLAAVSKFKV